MNHSRYRNSAHQAITRRCLPRARYAQLRDAERAAGPGQKPALCRTCGGFHLTTPTTSTAPGGTP